MRLGTLLLLSALTTACATKEQRAQAVDPPPWATEQGKQSTRIQIAERLIDAGSFPEAVNLLRAAVADGVEDPVMDLLFGRALHHQGLFGAAEPHLEKAATKLKGDPRPHRALGLLYADTDRPLEAIDALRRATDLDRSHAPTWNNLGYLLFTVKRDPDAVPALQKAVALDSTNRRYSRNLGFALFSQGRADEAIAAFQHADTPADASYNLGVAYQLAGDREMAKRSFQESLKNNPMHERAALALQELTIEESP
ncbi:MAG: tetratricopeptide repeat protein [Deltaproteobacteria bacterium]|nr:MAG: tetratricopeptide repeat protein [Deltaproteobacteria bacterium]